MLRNVIDLFTRLDEHEAPATIHGAFRASKTAIQAAGADAELLDNTVATLEETLGAKRFAAATARGDTMSDDDAVAFVMTTLSRINRADRPRAAKTPFR